jgi:hypothetical protein
VRAEEDRRVVQSAHLADEVLHLELRAGVEARRRLVEQEEHRRGEERPREGDLLLHPAREVLHRLAAPVRREADPLEDLRDPLARLRRRHAVEAGGVVEVLGGRHLLEEARLDRHAVHEPADVLVPAHDVVAEHARAPAIREEERREQADQSRLARPVLAEDCDAFASGDLERHVRERGHAAPAMAAVLADELLAQVARLDREDVGRNGRQLLHDGALPSNCGIRTCKKEARPGRASATDVLDTEQHRRASLPPSAVRL